MVKYKCRLHNTVIFHRYTDDISFVAIYQNYFYISEMFETGHFSEYLTFREYSQKPYQRNNYMKDLVIYRVLSSPDILYYREK